MTKLITITVRGGVIQDIEGQPSDVTIKIIDYDNDESDREFFWI